MPFFSNFLTAIAKVLDVVLSIFMWIVIARAILSWVSPISPNLYFTRFGKGFR